ncbi:hypothetical protein MYO4S_00009 [Serratia phage 4S]|nr:hypothetical protein MYO4S_00009 [Serratia phage 4S]
MELVENKCYRVIRKDDELLEQFPEFVVGAEFKAKQVVADGIVAVQFRNGPYVSIKDNPDSCSGVSTALIHQNQSKWKLKRSKSLVPIKSKITNS